MTPDCGHTRCESGERCLFPASEKFEWKEGDLVLVEAADVEQREA